MGESSIIKGASILSQGFFVVFFEDFPIILVRFGVLMVSVLSSSEVEVLHVSI